jgi:hypothetical protein
MRLPIQSRFIFIQSKSLLIRLITIFLPTSDNIVRRHDHHGSISELFIHPIESDDTQRREKFRIQNSELHCNAEVAENAEVRRGKFI